MNKERPISKKLKKQATAAEKKSQKKTFSSYRSRVLAVVLLLLLSAYWPISQMVRYWQAGQALTKAFEQANTGDLPNAEKSAWQAFALSKRLPEGAVLAARLALTQRNFSQALQYLDSLGETLNDLRPDLAMEALSVQAQAFEGSSDLSSTERTCNQLIALDGNHLQALTQLAKLLGTCGRREEAIPHVLKLVELGQVTDLLMLLTRDSGAIRNEQLLQVAQRKFPQDPLPLLGLANLAMESDDFSSASTLIEQSLKFDPNNVPARAMQLRLLAENERWDDLKNQMRQLPESLSTSLDRFASVWIARGRLAEHLQNVPGAIRCYAEAARRQPESRHPTSRLAVLLAQYGEKNLADQFAEYSRKLQVLRAAQDRILFAAAPDNAQKLLELIKYYEDCQRFWEARGWALWAAQMAKNSPQVQAALARNTTKTRSAPLALVDYVNHPVGAVALERFPLPNLRDFSIETESTLRPATPEMKFAFEDLSMQANFSFQFFYGTGGEPQRYMYELTGGGVGVLDFDQDGWEDIAVPQGKQWPPESDRSTERQDLLFRNRAGQKFSAIPLLLAVDGFGQGIACGDYDNDGFCDLYIAQIGSNRLLQNMGDGTFVDVTELSGLSDQQWTVSCLIADLNGDTYPDLYDVNYLQGEDLFTRICSREGLPAQCSPFDFQGAPDACWLGDGSGRFTRFGQDEIPIGRGLGAVAADLNGTGKLSLFIANDTDPNFLINFDLQGNETVASESGITSGVAFNESGKAEGSMGIALGDVNHDSRMDLFVTNFLNESNTYYRNQNQGMFVDVTKLSGLDLPSINVLGFGTQFVDVNLDGKLELFVANGHVDDLRAHNRPYKMLAHLYTSNGERFDRVLEAGEYFSQELLGRSVAKLDWNRDHKPDLVVSHLQSPYTLLTNQTTSINRPISIHLVGTKSSRDAVGATVTLVEENRRRSQQVTAGDGYESSNSKILIFDLQDQPRAKFEVFWPSGTKQVIDQLGEGSELFIVEPNKP